MREIRTSGSVRGARSNPHPYRDRPAAVLLVPVSTPAGFYVLPVAFVRYLCCANRVRSSRQR